MQPLHSRGPWTPRLISPAPSGCSVLYLLTCAAYKWKNALRSKKLQTVGFTTLSFLSFWDLGNSSSYCFGSPKLQIFFFLSCWNHWKLCSILTSWQTNFCSASQHLCATPFMIQYIPQRVGNTQLAVSLLSGISAPWMLAAWAVLWFLQTTFFFHFSSLSSSQQRVWSPSCTHIYILTQISLYHPTVWCSPLQLTSFYRKQTSSHDPVVSWTYVYNWLTDLSNTVDIKSANTNSSFISPFIIHMGCK